MGDWGYIKYIFKKNNKKVVNKNSINQKKKNNKIIK